MNQNNIPDEINDPDQNQDLGEPQSKTHKPPSRQAGIIAASVMVALAVLLLVSWALGKNGSIEQEDPTPTEIAEVTLVEPNIIHDYDAVPTVQPLQTREAMITPVIATPAPRSEVITYTIQEGENVTSIAAKFGLWSETILWANRYELEDDLRNYTPGTTIYILPVDGVYHLWFAGEGLGAVSKYYGVTPEDIINYPANNLDPATIGSYSTPNIKAGTRLVVPGGTLPNYFASDTLLYYAAVEELQSLPAGTSEAYPAPRSEVISYEVQPLDSIFSIADEFELEPETILWTNRYLIGDTPDGIYPGQKLIILPEDGVYHAWLYGEGLNGVSSGYGVTPADILEEPLNAIDQETIGDYSLPKIKTGTFLYIPGGRGSIPTWVSAVTDPSGESGIHPNVSYLGGYACNSTSTITGSGNFQLPTDSGNVGGYEYTPPVHNGLDYSGRTGYNVYAADTGVVIYAGWSNRGYGNTIVVSHGNGYLSLYAHLMDGGINVGCGSVVYGGSIIGFMGSTGNSSGPHLHFELRYEGSPVNPHNFGL
ncbi:MAG: peptidoglycan DD-metalloendopeptidase family protein [Anaerolineaceae bacterium]|nr:peptidoglycan DD-metalloendopeptidase family protein [Anaerolineaceae bacterium]